jgi:hypothetical protein
MPPDQNIQELIYSPAKPGGEGYLIAIAGPTGSGKTLSALRLARGMAGPDGIVAMADTENKRGLRYARQFTFQHAQVLPPFRPEKYVRAAEGAKQIGANVLIVDSMSHEHVGEGGVLDWQAEELLRLAGNDFKRAEQMKGVSWIAPKRAHKAMLQRLIQLNFHVIFCLRAEKKIEIVLNEKKNKIEWIDLGFQPICGSDFMFDMTMSFLLSAETSEQRGVPIPVKLDDQDRHLVFLDRPFDEEMGARIAAKAAGGSADPPPVESTSKPGRGETKNQAVANEIIATFDAVTERAEHEKLVDDPAMHEKLRWFREKRADLFKPIDVAIRASWKRVATDQPAAKPAKQDQDQLNAQGLIEEIGKALNLKMLSVITSGMFYTAPMEHLERVRPELHAMVKAAETAKADALKKEQRVESVANRAAPAAR